MTTDYARGLEDAAKRAEAEEELDGPIPEELRRRAEDDLTGMLRVVVRATKKSIAASIRSLAPAQGVETLCGCANPYPPPHACYDLKAPPLVHVDDGQGFRKADK